MAKEPADATLRMLRDIRATQKEHSDLLRLQADTLEYLRNQIQDWQETTSSAVGFAVHANIRHDTVEKRLEDLTKRVERLENQK
jgi:septal ring factor EnvC (AmiA/AmiB activator)